MSSPPVLRFAPSPNGRLHLGHAYSALYTASWAKKLGGSFVLRIEDIDITRCKPEFIDAIYEDLRWLGLDWPEPVMRQSERSDAYSNALSKLNAMGLIYPCFCSRKQVAEAATDTDPDGAPIYAGTCRHLSHKDREARLSAGETPNWRLDIQSAMARTGPLTFTIVQPTPADRPQIRYARPERWGDFVIARKEIGTSYHLAVVVDDAAQGITHVTRGRDLEAATDIHVLLQFLLGLPSPYYTHHNLILDHTEDKLAKSRGSKSLADLRQDGITGAQIRDQIGFGEL